MFLGREHVEWYMWDEVSRLPMRRRRLTRSLLAVAFALASTVAGAHGQVHAPSTELIAEPIPALRGGDRDDGHHAAVLSSTSQPKTAQSDALGGDAETWRARVQARLVELRREFAHSSEPVTPPADASAALQRRLAGVLARRTRGTRVGVHVRALDSQAVLFDRNGDADLNPASNQKLITAVAALELLGDDYRFRTELRRAGDTLYVVGEGDPSLQIVDLERLVTRAATELTDTGGPIIRRIVLDDSAFSERRFGPGYRSDGPAHSYAAPSSALALAFNTIEVEVRPGAYNARPLVQTSPNCGDIPVVNRARTGRGSKLDIDTDVIDGRTRITVHGRIVAGHAPVTVRRRIHDPVAYVGGCVSDLLAERTGASGWTLDLGTAPAYAQLIAVHESAPLREVLTSALRYSNNFTSEQVLRTLAWRTTGRPGTFADGVATVEAFWRTIGGDPDDLHLENGSGLSRDGRATARALVRVLSLTQRPDSPSAGLRDAMAVPGDDGTLRLRLTGLGPRLHAKTGTIAGVSALSGIVSDRTGQDVWAFSILVNGGRARDNRRLQDQLVLAMVDHLDVTGLDSSP